MKLRIIAGSLKGRIIRLPEKDFSVRPTLDRARTSIADMLQPHLAGATAADLCAGSGAFGFEMVSRGARLVDFVEIKGRRADLIREHAANFGIEARCRVIARDVRGYVQSDPGRYDVIFFDPPYDDRELSALVPALPPLLSGDGILVYQHRKPARSGTADPAGAHKPYDSRTFGDTVVDFYRRTENT